MYANPGSNGNRVLNSALQSPNSTASPNSVHGFDFSGWFRRSSVEFGKARRIQRPRLYTACTLGVYLKLILPPTLNPTLPPTPAEFDRCLMFESCAFSSNSAFVDRTPDLLIASQALYH